MATLSFYWHDYETFGRIPRYDRPAQFAGIRTDLELNEIGAPLMSYCQPTKDYLPDPESCLLTGIVPQLCLERGLPEHLFAAQIERELSQPGTVGVGYNTLRFDDEVTRYLFWRNLIDPYAREWQNGCSRWDILDLVRSAYALRPAGIVWPQSTEDRVSFKLEHLTAANGLSHTAAHDALSDVRATIALARLIKQQQPKLFEFCFKLRQKAAVISEIGIGRPFLHISGMYGVERGCLALVWPLAPHPTNKNEIIVWDLAHDPQELFDLDAKTIQARLFAKADKNTDPALPAPQRLPIKTIHLNKSPVVISNLKVLSALQAEQWGLDLASASSYAALLAQKGHLLTGIWPDVFERPVQAQTTDVDSDLYGGFIGPEDRRYLQKILNLEPGMRAQYLSERQPAFIDERLTELVFRYRARNFPDSLTPQEQAHWQAHCRQRLLEAASPHFNLMSFIERLDQLHETADEQTNLILETLYDYAEQLGPD